jgi:hypothetical protein
MLRTYQQIQKLQTYTVRFDGIRSPSTSFSKPPRKINQCMFYPSVLSVTVPLAPLRPIVTVAWLPTLVTLKAVFAACLNSVVFLFSTLAPGSHGLLPNHKPGH